MKFRLPVLACAMLLLAGDIAQAAEFTGKAVAVLDGDTLLVLRGGKPVKVRLAEVDAPEKAQPYGAASQKSLAGLALDKQVKVAVRASDDYGRLVATVQADGLDLNQEQVRRGMAWEYSRYHSNRELVALQREAQQAKRGLWAEAGAVEPSQWRKQHPDAQPYVTAAPAPRTGCGGKRHCSQMASCEEARHYLKQCGIQTLDGNGDGQPCEKLCAGEAVKLR